MITCRPKDDFERCQFLVENQDTLRVAFSSFVTTLKMLSKLLFVSKFIVNDNKY